MTDYRVVPGALRSNVKFLHEASDAWGKAHQSLTGMELAGDDLGILGDPSSATRNHNAAIQDALDRLRKGQEVLERAADELKGVADDYESRDAEYYEKFGYLRESM